MDPRERPFEPGFDGAWRDDPRERRYQSEQGFFQSGIAKCCCGCCCIVLVLLALLAGFLVTSRSKAVFGTTFTFFNYDVIMWQYRDAAAKQDGGQALSVWYAGLTEEDPWVGVGPGPNTLTSYGWQHVKELFDTFKPRTQQGTMKRYNELGLQILDDAMWPETGTSMFGLSNSDHALVRPYLFDSLDGAQGAWDERCRGKDCWNRPWLQQVIRGTLQQLDSFSQDDLFWMITQILHKIHLNMDVSKAEAQDFASFQSRLISQLPFGALIPGRYPASKRKDYLEAYKAAIEQKWNREKWQDVPMKHVTIASAMLDSLTLAGGYGVPKALDHLLAMMYMNTEPGPSVRKDLDIMNDQRAHIWDEAKLHHFIMEALRLFPPVKAVPRWITDDGGLTWQHQILSVEQAFKDPRVFPEPLEFQLGRPGLNFHDSSLSVGCSPLDAWAEFDPGAKNHECLAKELTMQILVAFLKEFQATGPWILDDTSGSIRLSSYGSSGWTLRKQHAFM
jgi:hypothetical protein